MFDNCEVIEYMNRKFKYGFTLAEVLITLAVIGIVAVMALPTVIQNFQLKSFDVKWKNFNAKMIQLTRNMAVGREFGPFPQSSYFGEKLPKYAKVMKVCDSSNMDECFIEEFSNDDEVINVADLTSSKNLGKDYENDNIGVSFLDGTGAIMSYNPRCKLTNPYAWLPGDNPVDCLSFIVDLNGFAKPNEVGKDIVTYGAQIVLPTKIGTTIIPCKFTLGASYGVECEPNQKFEVATVDLVATDYADLGAEYNASDNGAKMTCALANKVCEDAGMRLPSYLELNSMYNASQSGKLSGIVVADYWATCDASKYRNCNMGSGNCGNTNSSKLNHVRCVK